MPKRSNDRSPGDGRQPYSDIGGVEARHAQTHDVRREQATNPQGIDRSGEDFDADIAPATPAMELRTHADQSTLASDDKEIQARLSELSAEELQRLPVLETGTRLEQGGTYLDLNDSARGPFKALGTDEATMYRRYVAKKDVDYELWNRLVGAAHAPNTDQAEAVEQTSST